MFCRLGQFNQRLLKNVIKKFNNLCYNKRKQKYFVVTERCNEKINSEKFIM